MEFEKVEIGNATLFRADCMDILPTLERVDCVVTDPPYGFKLEAWDVEIDIDNFIEQARAVLTDSGFFAFFGVMPFILNWGAAANKHFKYSEHVVWLKRMQTPFSRNLNRSHESIMIYRLDRPDFYNTTGYYSDVKVPGLWFDAISIDAIQRHIDALIGKIKGNPHKHKIKNDTTSCNNCYNFFHRPGYWERATEYTNYTNVWSFASTPNRDMVNPSGRDHPMQKPIKLIVRLVEMLSAEGQMVCDPFMGSGTTGVACASLGRRFIGIEIDKKYFDIACDRIDREYSQGKLFEQVTS